MPLVKLISSGIGLAFEANAARKAHKADKAARSREISPLPGYSRDEYPEEKVVDVSHDQARELVNAGEAVPVDPKDSKDQPLRDEDYDEPPPAYAEADQMDEADWQLDEAIPDTVRSPSPSSADDSALSTVPSGKEAKKHYVDKIVQASLFRHNSPSTIQSTGNLPCPVIIPQRRPHSKSRGFVQAYAPVLLECGIDQDAFMAFHKAMFKASQASPVFDVINLAAAIAGLLPSVAAMVTSIVIQAATKTAIEVQSRQRTNSFLNQINDGYFRPRGLFCMVMKYDPKQKASHERVDISSTILRSLMPAESKTKGYMKNLKAASASTFGDVEMPEAAPLIFPGLDRVEDVDEKGKAKGGLKKTGEFLTNYYDKRAQAKYAVENEGSTLASALPQERKFASRFGDPNHPVNSGSLISLVTGGHLNPRGDRSGRQGGLGGLIGGREGFGRGATLSARSEESGSRHGHSYDNDYGRSYGRGSYGGRGSRRNRRNSDRRGGPLPIKYVKRMLQPNMLYLMIVNMPTEKEMEEARAILAASQK